MENDKEESPVPFLTEPEDKNDEAQYIKPNIEAKLPANKRMECRNIVKEVLDFGVNQRQLLYLIYLLTLELENREVMKALTDAIGENREKIPVSNLILPDQD